ncbi:MAG: type II secretion system protein GspJ [Gammaproteobacteria bacterium]|nr:type II secretion system protein GspJ [Gammaproteobacteria bacterium]
MRWTRHRSSAGFTLLEVLVAIAIFSVMAVLAYEGLRNFLAARTLLDNRTGVFHARVRGMAQMQQDLEQLVARPVRDELGDPVDALRRRTGEEVLLAFTRHSPWPAPSRGLPDLRRVEYRLLEGRLLRREWDALDRVSSVGYRERTLLSGVESVQLRFHGAESWQDDWAGAAGPASRTDLPRAVGVLVRFADGRSLERILRPGGAG